MSVDGVLCVLGSDRGCVVEGHGGRGFPPFSAAPTCVFWVPRMGPGTSPGQPSMLRLHPPPPWSLASLAQSGEHLLQS